MNRITNIFGKVYSKLKATCHGLVNTINSNKDHTSKPKIQHSNTLQKQTSFLNFMWKNKENKKILIFSFIAALIQFILFKYFYPLAGFIYGDSFVYLDTAIYSKDINTYMVGYGYFLRIFSTFTKSNLALVTFQYFLLQAATLLLLFTIFYFYKPIRAIKYILLSLIVFNPLPLYLSNYISSDSLFVSISMIWLALLIWIMLKPTARLMIWHAIALYIVFTLRYNALIYPLISIISFLLAKATLRQKAFGIGISITLITTFVLYTTFKYKELTNEWQYAPFSGWQWTNNAMYAYRYVNKSERKEVPLKYKALDNMIREYFDSTKDLKKYPYEGVQASTMYMWSPGMPMFKYRDSLFKIKDSTANEFKRWASMGPLYSEYGKYIISHYPFHYLKYFIWPNANKYYAPPIEFLQNYNSGKKEFPKTVEIFFNLENKKAYTRTHSFKVTMLEYYPIVSAVSNVLVLFSLIGLNIVGGFKRSKELGKIIILGATVWILNAGFTIFASSVALRFQTFPSLLSLILSIIMIDRLFQFAFTQEQNNSI